MSQRTEWRKQASAFTRAHFTGPADVVQGVDSVLLTRSPLGKLFSHGEVSQERQLSPRQQKLTQFEEKVEKKSVKVMMADPFCPSSRTIVYTAEAGSVDGCCV